MGLEKKEVVRRVNLRRRAGCELHESKLEGFLKELCHCRRDYGFSME